MSAAYEDDVILWAKEQAAMLLSGQFDALDIEHIADEIESVGKAEQGEFYQSIVTLLVHLLRWQTQTAHKSIGWEISIKAKKNEVNQQIECTPSLAALLKNEDWLNVAWSKAVAQAVSDTGLDLFPEICPWTTEQIIENAFLPNN